MVKQGLCCFYAIVLCGGVLAGCSGDKKQGESGGDVAASVHYSPATVSVAIVRSYLTDAEIQRFIIEPVQKKYPHITVNPVILTGNVNLPNLIASGDTPDLITANNITLIGYKQMGLPSDIGEVVQKNKFNLDRFKPDTLDAIKIGYESDYLIGIPYTMQFNALYYNKDIFDRFGVPYPKDGSTWFQLIELARTLTRQHDGVKYRGFEPDSLYRAGSQQRLPLVDPKTHKSIGNTEQWKKTVDMVRSIYEIPGNDTVATFSAGVKAFSVDRNLAMIAGLNWLGNMADVKNEFSNWDLSTYPVFPEQPGIGTQIDIHLMMMSAVSKNKDDALRVVEVMTSDEVQLDMARYGKVSVLKDKKFEQEFAKDMDFLKGKNIQAVFKTKPQQSFPPTEYGSIAFNEITNLMKTIVKDKTDTNTALRNYDELMNKKIAEIK